MNPDADMSIAEMAEQQARERDRKNAEEWSNTSLLSKAAFYTQMFLLYLFCWPLIFCWWRAFAFAFANGAHPMTRWETIALYGMLIVGIFAQVAWLAALVFAFVWLVR